MRANEAIEVTFKIPFSVETPDANGCIYAKEVLERAARDVKDIPIVTFRKKSNDKVVVGVAKNMMVEDCKLVVNGWIFHGGTAENVDIEDHTPNESIVLTSFDITEIGIDIK